MANLIICVLFGPIPYGREKAHTIDTEIRAKRNNIISELIAFRITKAKAKVKFGVKYLCKHQCGRSSVPININTKRESDKIFGGINFTSTSAAMRYVCVCVCV